VRRVVRKVRKATAAVIAAATEGDENGNGSCLEQNRTTVFLHFLHCFIQNLVR